jgi:hypothetical protein
MQTKSLLQQPKTLCGPSPRHFLNLRTHFLHLSASATFQFQAIAFFEDMHTSQCVPAGRCNELRQRRLFVSGTTNIWPGQAKYSPEVHSGDKQQGLRFIQKDCQGIIRHAMLFRYLDNFRVHAQVERLYRLSLVPGSATLWNGCRALGSKVQTFARIPRSTVCDA